MKNLFGKVFANDDMKNTGEKNPADRLRYMLLHDRVDISPQYIAALRKDMLSVIGKYMDVDETSMKLQLCEDENNKVFLVTNIEVTKVNRAAKKKADEDFGVV